MKMSICKQPCSGEIWMHVVQSYKRNKPVSKSVMPFVQECHILGKKIENTA